MWHVWPSIHSLEEGKTEMTNVWFVQMSNRDQNIGIVPSPPSCDGSFLRLSSHLSLTFFPSFSPSIPDSYPSFLFHSFSFTFCLKYKMRRRVRTEGGNILFLSLIFEGRKNWRRRMSEERKEWFSNQEKSCKKMTGHPKCMMEGWKCSAAQDRENERKRTLEEF